MAIPIRVGQARPAKANANTNRKTQDPRLWFGILFILAAMVIGQLVITKASARVSVVALNSNIAAGSVIRESDISTVQVSVPNVENLIAVPSEVVGKITTTDMFIGDLVNVRSVTNGFASDVRTVSVPVRAGHLPQVSPGEKVDVWMTPSLDGVALPGPASLIIPNAVVFAAPEFVDAGMDTSVTLLILQEQVQVLVQAMRDGVIDLVAIPVAGNEL